jgi:hypothetical protein
MLVVKLFFTGGFLLWGQFFYDWSFFRFRVATFIFSFTVIVFILFRPIFELIRVGEQPELYINEK